MPRSRSQNRKRTPKATASLPVIHPHAAGIDVGSETMFVSVPTDSSDTPIGQFGTFTEDLHAIGTWLKDCGVETVAMESTGVYWIPLYELLEHAGLEVVLVNPNYPKKPYKSDVEDCQWLQYLHSVGLLKGSFRPAEQVCAVRSILRQRARTIREAASYIQLMQKSLTQMNIKIQNVISDITGVTGLAIIDSILQGQHNPKELAKLRDSRIKATPAEVEKSLVGNYRPEHIFTLKQARDAYSFYRAQAHECDLQIERMLKDFDSALPDDQPPSAKPNTKRQKNAIRMADTDLAAEMHRILGVNLTDIPAIGPLTAHTIFCELGSDLSKFESAEHFASWLRVCPNNKVSGGVILKKGAPKAKSPVAVILRQVAQGLQFDDSYLGDFFRRIKARLGPAAAVTATTHKLAKIIYTVMTTKQPYDESRFNTAKEKMAAKRFNKLRRDAQALGYTLSPTPAI